MTYPSETANDENWASMVDVYGDFKTFLQYHPYYIKVDGKYWELEYGGEGTLIGDEDQVLADWMSYQLMSDWDRANKYSGT